MAEKLETTQNLAIQYNFPLIAQSIHFRFSISSIDCTPFAPLLIDRFSV